MIFRLVRLLGRSLAAALIAVSGLFVALEFAAHRRLAPAGFVTWRQSVFRLWSRALCRVLGVTIVPRGPVPEAPFLLISNHLGYLDIVVLASLTPGRFVAKAEIERWPLVGRLCRAADTIFVDRSSRRDVVRVDREMVRAIEEGDGVILFPEGTSGRGDEVMPFKASLLDWPARSGQPVHVAAIHYATPPDQPAPDMSVAWWGTMSMIPHLLRMLQLSRIDARVTYSSRTLTGDERKALCGEVREAVIDHFEPLRQTPTSELDFG